MPVRYLILIEHAHVLRALYGTLLVPPIVITELSKPATPPIVREWISDRPGWLQVQAPTRERLRQTNFRATESLLQSLLARDAARRQI